MIRCTTSHIRDCFCVQTRRKQGYRPDLGADFGRKWLAFAATYRVKEAPDLMREILTDFMEKELEQNIERRRRYAHNLRVRSRIGTDAATELATVSDAISPARSMRGHR
jgi:hypothetical protein